MPYRLGFDVGGTFTDFVLQAPGGELVTAKRLTTYPDPAEACLAGLDQLLDRAGVAWADVAEAVHGTTLGSNIVIERKGRDDDPDYPTWMVTARRAQYVPRRGWTLVSGILNGLVTPWEIPRLIRGNEVSLAAMHAELQELDLARSVPAVDVPVVFLLGRYDRHVDAKLAAAYLEALAAPSKRLVWFERSAHNVPFEEPERFGETVVSELGALEVR